MRRHTSPEHTGRTSGVRVATGVVVTSSACSARRSLESFSNANPFAPARNGCTPVGAFPSASKLQKAVIGTMLDLSPLGPTICFSRSGRSPDGPPANHLWKDRMVFPTISSVKTLAGGACKRGAPAWWSGVGTNFDFITPSTSGVLDAKGGPANRASALLGTPCIVRAVALSCRRFSCTSFETPFLYLDDRIKLGNSSHKVRRSPARHLSNREIRILILRRVFFCPPGN